MSSRKKYLISELRKITPFRVYKHGLTNRAIEELEELYTDAKNLGLVLHQPTKTNFQRGESMKEIKKRLDLIRKKLRTECPKRKYSEGTTGRHIREQSDKIIDICERMLFVYSEDEKQAKEMAKFSIENHIFELTETLKYARQALAIFREVKA